MPLDSITFDDLIPAPKPSGSISFDDLIPAKPAASERDTPPQPPAWMAHRAEEGRAVIGAAKEGWENTPSVLTDTAKDWLGRQGYFGGVGLRAAEVADVVAGGLGAAFRGGQEVVRQTAQDFGAPPGMARDIAALPEAFPLAGIETGLHPRDVGTPPPPRTRVEPTLGRPPPEPPRALAGPETPPVQPLGPLALTFDDLVPAARRATISEVPASAAPTGRGAEPAGTTPVVQASPASIVSLDPAAIGVDAQRFQFKAGGDETGVTDRLQDVEKWDPRLAGISLVWRDEAGKDWIADGHQRLGLAKRLSAAGQPDIRINAFVLDSAAGITDADARVIAAAKNIAEGTGTPIDAAKIMREASTLGVEMPPLPPQSVLVRDGRALSRLGLDAFRMTVNGIVPVQQAAIVGRIVADPLQQTEAMRVLAKLSPSNARQAEMVVRDVMATSERRRGDGQGGLFGDEDYAASATLERAQVVDEATRQLARDRTTFRTLVDEADRIEGHGENVLDTGANRARLSVDEQAKQLLTQFATRHGPVSDALTGIARRVRSGDIPASAGARELLGVVRGAIAEGVERGDRAGGAVAGPDAPGGLASPANGPNILAEPIDAYHGTPHEFDAFDTTKIGTGEGAQAYGHGLYFAENPGVARSYRTVGVTSPHLQVQDVIRASSPVAPASYDEVAANIRAGLERQTSPSVQALAKNESAVRDIYRIVTNPPDLSGAVPNSVVDAYRRLDGLAPEQDGHLLTVRINAEPHEMLDWDKPLSEQSPQVRDGVRQALLRRSGVAKDKDGNPRVLATNPTGADVWHTLQGMNPAGASGLLRENGVKGIRYLDQGSRHAGEGTRNVVVFDHNDIEITHRNGEPVTPKTMTAGEAEGMAEGRPAFPQTETPEFRAWFGDSKVVDADGKPLVVYHQTASDRLPHIYTEGFSTEKSKARARLSDSVVPNGIFFKPNERDIGVGAPNASDQGQIPVYLSIKNPLVVADRDALQKFTEQSSPEYRTILEDEKAIDRHYDAQFESEWRRLGELSRQERSDNLDSILKTWIASQESKASEARELVDAALLGAGYDGVIIDNDVGSLGRKTKTYIALSPTQIKSPGNRGTFDQNNPSILAEGRRLPLPPNTGGPDLLGRTTPEPTPRATREPLIRNDQRQVVMPGMEPSAVQAQAARDQAARGGINPRGDVKPADEGLFAKPEVPQAELLPGERSGQWIGGQPDLRPRPPRSRWPIPTDQLHEVPRYEPDRAHETAANWVFDQGRKTGHEHIAVVDNASGQIVHAGTSNHPRLVHFSPANVADMPADSVVIHHNHPNGTGPSQEDIQMAALPAIARVVAVGPGAETYVVAVSPAMRKMVDLDGVDATQREVGKRYGLAYSRAMGIVTPLFRDEKLTADAANKAVVDIINRLLQLNGTIDYASSHTLPEAVHDRYIRNLTESGTSPDRARRSTGTIQSSDAIASLPRRLGGEAGSEGTGSRGSAPPDAAGAGGVEAE